MKVCIINNLYHPYSRGGAETVVFHMLNALQGEGHGVCVISTKPWFKKTKEAEENTIYIRSIYHQQKHVPKPLRVILHLSNMLNPWTYVRLKKIIKEQSPDLIIGNNLIGLSILIPRLVDKLNIKYIQIIHDIQLLHPSGLMIWGKEDLIETKIAKIYQFLNRFLYNKVKLVVSPSKWLLSLYRDKGFFKNAKARIIVNPMRIVYKTEAVISNPVYRFIFVGRISKDKGAYLLLSAFKKAHDSNELKNIELVLVGDDDDEERTKKLCASNSNIKFRGRLNNKEVMNELNKADCLIMPSLCYENSPTVIYEALSKNCRIIASRIGGVKEMEVDERVRLFEPGNIDDLVSKIDAIIKNTSSMESDKVLNKFEFNSPKDYIQKIFTFINQKD